MRTPLPCFGLERISTDAVCLACKHYEECGIFMGTRVDRVPLSQAKFNLIPPKLSGKIVLDDDAVDPEEENLGNVYIDAYRTIFGKRPTQGDNPLRFRDKIVLNARTANTGIRLFMLANMLAHKVQEQLRLENTESALTKPYAASTLTSALSVTRCNQYAEMCSKQFGSFNLTMLSTISKNDFELNDVERAMLNSEVTAARFVIQHKIFNGGPPYVALYEHEELGLSPYWLAIEKSYDTHVLAPFRESKTGSKMQQSHRYDVLSTRRTLSRYSTEQVLLFAARQRIMADAVKQVLAFFNRQPDDFDIEPFPITDAMDFWVYLSRAVQHYETLLFYRGEPNRFSDRRKRIVNIEALSQD